MTSRLDKITKIISGVIIVLSVITTARFALHGDLFFHTDIARDFLIMEDMVATKKPTLLGPRSGGIPGVFHGPLWFYVSLPVFLISNGDPSYFAWFWVFLNITSLLILLAVSKKIFNMQVAMVSVAIFASTSIFFTHNLFNPFGAVVLSPIFIYFLLIYSRNKNVFHLAVSLLTLGFIFQFQMAFAGPIILLTIAYLLYFTIKHKKLAHLLTIPVLLFPLITFFVFEIRHNFLQSKSVINYISANGEVTFNFVEHLFLRVKAMIFDGLNVFSSSELLLKALSAGAIIAISFKAFVSRQVQNRDYYLLLLYFYLGYWTITLLFRGELWGYYWWPFSPLIVLFFVAGIYSFFQKYANGIVLVAMTIGLVIGVNYASDYDSFIGKDGGSWNFHQSLAESLFSNAEENFGYYIFTPDQYGYSSKYAVNFVGNKSVFDAEPYSKLPVTYLVYAPPPDDKPELNGEWWKAQQVRIDTDPSTVIEYDNGYRVEKYYLSKEEQGVESDQNLITDLHFR